MRRARLALALSVLLPGLAAAGDAPAEDDWRPPPGLVGLLAPPLVENGPPGCVGLDAATEHLLFQAPDLDSERVGRLRLDEDRSGEVECLVPRPAFLPVGGSEWFPLRRLELDYDETALAVLARGGDWSLIALPGGRQGWLAPFPGQRYAAVAALLPERLSYLMPGWDGALCDTPSPDHCRQPEVRDAQAITVHGHRESADGVWLDVELFDAWCGAAEPTPLGRGWIRAAGTDGRPAAWFHSRGC